MHMYDSYPATDLCMSFLLERGVTGEASAVKRLSGSYNASELFQTAPVHTQRMYNMGC
jgi:hypothetical protein